MNVQLLQNKSAFQPKKGHQRDPYIGSLHTQTKKRHGKGNYQYQNKFFQYDGQYVQGKKQGFGVLNFNDGTKIQANFINDEIEGEGKITYPDKSVYTGFLHLGQKHGKGIFQSIFQKYQGEWRENSKQGQGKYTNLTNGQIYEGTFKNNKFQGTGSLSRYNYSYLGQWSEGRKQGHGQQINLWRRLEQQQKNVINQGDKKTQKFINYDGYCYQGNFMNDQFNGEGKYLSRTSNYVYSGEFSEGLPKKYPNQFRVYVTTNIKSQTGQIIQTQKVLIENTFQYELQSDSKNIYVQCVYQGPEYLDENQPSEQQIDQLVKNWQNQNKKNKSPPPMPDFKAPKMKKPELLLITQQSLRPITFTLQKEGSQANGQKMKVDYRTQILKKREQFQKVKQQQKKNQEQDSKKKGGKKQVKSDNQFKINIFEQKPKRIQTAFKSQTQNGAVCFQKFELPDDFPQNKFIFKIESNFIDFGSVQPRKIQFIVKSKQAATKKK